MPTPSTGVISMSNIQAEFGGTFPIGFSEYLGVNVGVPLSGVVSMSNMYNRTSPSVLNNFAYPLPKSTYSIEQLVSTYTGPQMRIRNGTLNTEANLYVGSNGTVSKIETFNNAADTTVRSTVTGSTSYSNWLGSATGYVTTWFDQSSNFHLTQTSTANQPIYSQTSKAIVFNNSNNTFLRYNSNWAIYDCTLYCDYTPNIHPTTCNNWWYDREAFIFCERGGPVDDWGFMTCGLAPATSSFMTWGSGTSDGVGVTIQGNGLGNRVVFSVARDANTGAVVMYRDGSNISSTTRDLGLKWGDPTNSLVGYKLNGSMKTLLHYSNVMNSNQVFQIYRTMFNA